MRLFNRKLLSDTYSNYVYTLCMSLKLLRHMITILMQRPHFFLCCFSVFVGVSFSYLFFLHSFCFIWTLNISSYQWMEWGKTKEFYNAIHSSCLLDDNSCWFLSVSNFLVYLVWVWFLVWVKRNEVYKKNWIHFSNRRYRLSVCRNCLTKRWI